MSALADRRKRRDDYPDAAKKHLDDAGALVQANRFDGCFYLAGYVVECALKSVLLHEASWDQATRCHTPRKLNAGLDRLQTPNHSISDLYQQLTTAAALATSTSAKYVPKPEKIEAVRRWNPSVRYQPPAKNSQDSNDVLAAARQIYKVTIQAMQLDGVL